MQHVVKSMLKLSMGKYYRTDTSINCLYVQIYELSIKSHLNLMVKVTTLAVICVHKFSSSIHMVTVRLS